MRRIVLLLLALSLPVRLFSQVKILMPVVVKDANGRADTDLKTSDFQVSGPKNISIDQMWLVPPQTVNSRDNRTPIVVLYDAVNIPNQMRGQSREASTNVTERQAAAFRSFLEQVAGKRLPITLLVNTKDGVRLIYDSRTAPEVLTEALAITAGSKTPTASTKVTSGTMSVDEQVKNLNLLASATWVPRSQTTSAEDQMNSLMALARLSGAIRERKALVWITSFAPVPVTEQAEYWASPDVYHRSLLPLYEAMIEELNAARFSVYPLQWNWSGVDPLYTSQESFRQIAASTGGLALNFDRDSIFGATEAAMRDFGCYYVLAVELPTPKQLDWIPVKIKVNRPGLTVRAAPGFLGLKPEKAAKPQTVHP